MDLVITVPLDDDEVARLTAVAGSVPVADWVAERVQRVIVAPLRYQQRRQAQRAVVEQLKGISDEALTKVADAIDVIAADDRVGAVRVDDARGRR